MPVVINGSTGISTPGLSSTADVTLAGASVELLNNSGRIVVGQSGSVIQVASTTQQGVITTTATGAPSTITNGVQVFSLSFTPTNASSTILVQTSTVAISEGANFADVCWLALWDGSTFIAANSGTWYAASFGSGYNGDYVNINESYSAGSTSARTIQVRAGMNSGTGTVYVNGNSSANYTGTSAQIRMIVWEIAG
jgi:hypothetical protein